MLRLYNHFRELSIVIASRNLSKVSEAVHTLIAETEYPHIEGMTLDLASLASVRQFAQDIIVGERPPCPSHLKIATSDR